MKKMKENYKVAKFFNYKDVEETKVKKYSAHYKKACEIRSSARWGKVREIALKRYSGMCSYCFKVPAVEVHHIKPVSFYPELAYDLDNLSPLCVKDHRQIEVREKRGENAEEQLRERMKITLDKIKNNK
jgi:5-methylcytosine-specific restriction endonuclease McrA